MSKPVKEMLMRDYSSILEGVEDALIVSVRGIDANETNDLRMDLAKQNVKVTVIRNSLARKAFEDTSLSGLDEFLAGPSAIAFGGESVVDVARALVEWAKKIDQLELKGAILDGQVFSGEAGVVELSKYPTRDEAIAKAVTLVLSPAQKLVGAAKGPGSALASIVKAIEEKLEKGETIAKAG